MRIRYLVWLSFFFITPAFAQEQKVADSLKIIYAKENLHDTVKLEVLFNLAFNENTDLLLAIKYTDEILALSRKLNDNKNLYGGYFLKGNKYKKLGNLDAALEAYIKSVEVAKLRQSIPAEAAAYSAIATVFKSSNNYTNAMVYFRKAISALRQANDSVTLATVILNTGEAFRTHQEYDSALQFFTEASSIFEKINYPIGKAYGLGNIGLVYASTGKNNLAEKYMNEATIILENLEDFYPICVYLLSMADLYLQKGDRPSAMNYAQRSLKLATQYKLKEQRRDSNLKLSELYEQSGNTAQSYKHYKDYIIYRDSVNNLSTVQKMADLRTDYEVSQKQIEVVEKEALIEKEKWIRNTFVAGFGIMIVLALMAYRNFKNVQTKNKKITEQNIEIEEKNKELIDLNTEKNHLIGIVAHDLRNPLGYIKLLISLIKQKGKVDDGSAEYLNSMGQTIKHLNGMISKILDIEAIEARHLNLKLEEINLSELLKNSANHFENDAAEKSIQLKRNIADDLIVKTDLGYMGQILENLISNALKFSPSGKTVFVNLSSHNGEALIEIRDEGPGLSENDMQKLFGKYQKLSARPTGDEISTGLGLSIVKKLVDAMDGNVWCESEIGKGASFKVKLQSVAISA